MKAECRSKSKGGVSIMVMSWILFFSLTTLTSGCQTSPVQQSQRSIFEFHSSLWVNLHHYLYNEAFRSDKASQPMTGLSTDEKTQLSQAIEFYKTKFKDRDFIFDKGLQKINIQLSAVENRANLQGIDIPDDLRSTLERTQPIYKLHLWSNQDKENREWITKAQALLAKYEVAIQNRLEIVLNRRFFSGTDRVDIVREANWAGAYTYTPPHTVISSGRATNSDLAALELLFHESLHAGPFDTVQTAIDQVFLAQHKKDDNDLWHAIHFFTVGEVVRSELAKHQIEYTPYAEKNGLYKRGSWVHFEPLINKYWLPYLEGKTDMKSALHAIVHAENSKP